MHPYKTLPPEAFWSKAVSANFDARNLLKPGAFNLGKADRVVTAGSCFAANLIPFLEQAGVNYVRTEYVQPIYSEVPRENLGYANFSAGYGNIYTARQLLQLLLRCQGKFSPMEDKWLQSGGIVDPFRPGLRYVARSDREFGILTAQHLAATRRAFEQCDVFIFTLGLTEAWCSKLDGAVFPACPGTVAGQFDSLRHVFCNFNVQEVAADLSAAIDELRILSPAARVILTVSPVPLIATAAGEHVLTATTYSKSVLRVAAGDIARARENVFYFPSYEMIVGPHKQEDFFEDDRRSVRESGIAQVMDVFFHACGLHREHDAALTLPAGRAADDSKGNGQSFVRASNASARLSALVSAAECEEAMVEK